MIDDIRQDLRFAYRSLIKRPLFLVVPVLSLTVGIGANTAIFSAVNRYVLSPPDGIPNASRMVEVGKGTDGEGFDSFSYPDLMDLREEARPLEELAGFSLEMLTLSRGEAGDRVMGLLASANYFDLMGVRPHLGRTFLPEEDVGADEHPVVVLSYETWRSRMGSDPEIIGSTVYVSRQPYTVIGVAPEAFRGHMLLVRPDIYLPIVQQPSLKEGRNWLERRSASWMQVLGRIRPGATLAEAQAAASTVFQRLAEEYPETNASRTVELRAYASLPAFFHGPVKIFLSILMAFVGLILLITCANVAGIFLARASSRRKEIAIRLSIGSGRGRLIRHFLTESLLIFLLGGIGGILLATWGLDFVASMEIPAPVPIRLDLAPDGFVLAYAVLLTLGTGLVFGLLPARQALELDLLGTLKDEGARARSSEGRMRRVFVAAQISASLVLLVAAGLLLRALQSAGEIEKGFTAEGAYVHFLNLSAEGFGAEDGAVFQNEILEHLSNQAWVENVALATDLPLDLSVSGTGVVPEGWEAPEGRETLGVDFNAVSPGYFPALRMPILEGRGFSAGDREGTEAVAVVSRTFADQVWPGESALGRRVLWGASGDEWMTVVGVVADVHNQLLTDVPRPFLYRPHTQLYRPNNNLVVQSSLPHQQVIREIHEGLRALDPNISLSPVVRLDRLTGIGLLPQRVAGILATSLGLLALLLSGMGVYGVMAFMVTTRTREMGIRAALGAEPGRVLRSVLGGAFRLALPGLVVGIALAAGVGILLRSLLLGVSPVDPLALAGVAAAMAGMVLAGTLVPARKAAKVDPVEALRYD